MCRETTEDKPMHTCLVIYCTEPKLEGWNFCDHHHASPEQVGFLKDRLAAAEKQHASLLSEIRDARLEPTRRLRKPLT